MENPTTTDAAGGARLVWLDPADLLENPANPRDSLGDLTGLVKTIEELGVVEPLVVVPTGDGGYMTVVGHRRRAAALEAGVAKVPCWVRDDLTGRSAEQLVRAIVENDHRHHISEAERTKGFTQLAAWGWEADTIARRAGTEPDRVHTALRVGASEPAVTALAARSLTLEQAGAVAEIDDDPAAVETLLAAADRGTWAFEHALTRLRQDREHAATRRRLIDEHTAAGIPVVAEPPVGGDSDVLDVPRALWHLTDGDGTPLDLDSHCSCPGHAVHISDDGWREPQPLYVCADPDAHGHRCRQAATGAKKPEAPPRAEVIAKNKQWRAATATRRRFLKELLARRTPPDATLVFVTQEIMASPEHVGSGVDLLTELCGTPAANGHRRRVGPTLAAKATRKRLPLVLLAQVAADHENAMTVHTWRQSSPRAARWLSFLDSTGYTLSDIEQHVVDTAHRHADTSRNGTDPQEDQTPGSAEAAHGDAQSGNGAEIVTLPSPADRADNPAPDSIA